MFIPVYDPLIRCATNSIKFIICNKLVALRIFFDFFLLSQGILPEKLYSDCVALTKEFGDAFILHFLLILLPELPPK